MAKRIVASGLIFLILVTFTTAAYCDNPIKKLGRGICNMLTFPLEMYLQPSRVNTSDGPMAGITYGVLQGIAMTGLRALVGVYEVVTFPIPFPKDYGPILTNPEFFFEEQNW